jgi:hypothetical protein
MHSFQTPEFVNAVDIVFDLPEGPSKSDLEGCLGSKITSILVMFGTFKGLGILIFRREIDIKLVEDFCGGVIILAGRKFKRYLAEMQDSSNRSTIMNGFGGYLSSVRNAKCRDPWFLRSSPIATGSGRFS